MVLQTIYNLKSCKKKNQDWTGWTSADIPVCDMNVRRASAEPQRRRPGMTGQCCSGGTPDRWEMEQKAGEVEDGGRPHEWCLLGLDVFRSQRLSSTWLSQRTSCRRGSYGFPKQKQRALVGYKTHVWRLKFFNFQRNHLCCQSSSYTRDTLKKHDFTYLRLGSMTIAEQHPYQQSF